MSVLRFLAVVVIFGTVTIAWAILGGTVTYRTAALDDRLSEEMSSLWGPEALIQPAPYLAAKGDGKRTDAGSAGPAASKIAADIQHEYRYKGLLWYSTFTVKFAAEYTLPAAKANGFFVFHLPDGITSHDGLRVTLDGRDVEIAPDQKASGKLSIPIGGEGGHVVSVAFTTYGQDAWLYAPGEAAKSGSRRRDADTVISSGGAMSELKNFSLTVTTNFREIDYPKGTRSPVQQALPNDGGMQAQWQYGSQVTNQAMGVLMPRKPNAGPIAARMSFFAPVSLFFFFTVLFTVVVLKKIPLHPMHYLFISAGFFAFHILLAYLADLVNIHASFWICAAVSVFLVVSYMRLVAGVKFAVLYAGAAQLVYLVGFAYAFFFKGRTGLAVTIGAILTLFILMQATGRINWHQLFDRHSAPPRLPRRAANGSSSRSTGCTRRGRPGRRRRPLPCGRVASPPPPRPSGRSARPRPRSGRPRPTPSGGSGSRRPSASGGLRGSEPSSSSWQPAWA